MKLTQSLKLHLNGGNKFSEFVYDVLADGKPTGITIHKRTDGSPHYRITQFIVCDGDATFDVLAARGNGMVDWIENQIRNNNAATRQKEE